MRDVLAELMSIWRAGGTAGVATVVRTQRSAPRLPGATMVVASDGTVATHDPKFDVPVLQVALRLRQVGYIGAMGSRRTHNDRLNRLREVGLTEAELSRLASPTGLDLGARTPEETAVSIAAEIIAHASGRGGRPLAEVDGPIHHNMAP